MSRSVARICSTPRLLPVVAVALLGLVPASARAIERGDLSMHVIAHRWTPVHAGGDLQVQPYWSLELGARIATSESTAAELVLPLPFPENLGLEQDGHRVAEASYTAPSLSWLWSPSLGPCCAPYVGAGVMAGFDHGVHGRGSWTGADVSMKSTVGPCAVTGLSVRLGPAWTLGLDARYAKLSSKVQLRGQPEGSVRLDAVAVGLAVGYRF